MPRYTLADLRGQRLHWLVSVTVRGRVWRFSEDDLAVTDGSDKLHFAGGLEAINYDEMLPEPGGAAEANAAAIQLTFAGEDADGWADLVRASRGIGAATCEVAIIRDSDAWSSREVLLDGRVDALTYGAYDEPIAFQVEESPWDVRSPPFPPSNAAVTDATWPRAGSSATHMIGEGVEGMVYPWVFGAPGRGPGGRRFPGSPALLVEIPNAGDNSAVDAYVLIAGHRSKADGASNAIRLYNETTGSDNQFTPSTTQDLLGREVTIVQVSNANLPITEGDELWVSWAASANGGLIGPRAGATLRRADDVLGYLLGQSGARHLGGAFAQIDGRLSYPMDFVHNDSGADPLDVVRSILAYLPASYRIGPEGLEVVRWPFDAEHGDELAHIDPGLHFGHRSAGPQLSPISEVENTIEARYAQNLKAGTLIGRTVYAPSRITGDTDVQTNPWAAASASVYGDRSGTPLEMPHLVEPGTAAAVLDFAIGWRSQQREYVTYLLPQEYQAIRPGSVVTVTDADILWTTRLCCVLGVRRGPEMTEMALVTLPSWVRDATE